MQTIDRHKTQVELIRSESTRLMEYVNDLPPEALEKPSPCEKWNIGEVIAHLLWHVEAYGDMMERGLRGDQSPTYGFPSLPPGTPNSQVIVDEFYGQAAIDTRRSLGQNLIPAFNERYGWLNNMMAEIAPEDWDKPCYHSRGTRSVESFLSTFLMELGVHEWDIRSLLEPSPAVSEGVIPVLMDKIPSKNGRPWSISFPDMEDAPGPVRYRFELTGVSAKKLDVVVEDNMARLETAAEAPADAYISCDTGTFVLLMYGRLSLDSAKSAGRLKAEGDPGLVAGFDRWLQG